MNKDRQSLHCYLWKYIPQGWVGPIHQFDFVPHISEAELEVILAGGIPKGREFEKWYIQDGIRDWLKDKPLDKTQKGAKV